MNRIIILAVAGLFVASGLLFAEEVLITKRGLIYHSADCEEIKDEETAIVPLEEAQEKGMRPCPVCQKDANTLDSNAVPPPIPLELNHSRSINEFKVR